MMLNSATKRTGCCPHCTPIVGWRSVSRMESVDRDIAPGEFRVAWPEHPDRIGGSWYGDHLDLNCALAALQFNVANNTNHFPAGKHGTAPPLQPRPRPAR